METASDSVAGVDPTGGGSAAASALYAAHSQAVYYLALRLLGDPARAEDAAHDVFLKAFESLARFRGGASVKTWLYRITLNHCINLRKSWEMRNIQGAEDPGVFEGREGGESTPFRLLEAKELGVAIQRTLDQLPEDYRVLLLLVADEDLSYEEIGQLTVQSPDAVRGKLHRARKAFKSVYSTLHRA